MSSRRHKELNHRNHLLDKVTSMGMAELHGMNKQKEYE
jgi:hypothetical protein